MQIINFAYPEIGNVFSRIFMWLVNGTSIVAAIVLFTIGLKIITLPFDYVSRRSMRRNSLLMEEMRPELEKLQKQYADNKQLYQQKMMALYKKNGYSMFGSCLPTILTLVIFIIAINGFSAYSRFQNKEYVYDMSLSYNSVVYDGISADGEYIVENENGSKSIVIEKFKDKTSPIQIDNGGEKYEIYFTDTITGDYVEKIDGVDTILGKKGDLQVYTENGYTNYKIEYIVLNDGTTKTSEPVFSVISGVIDNKEDLKLDGKSYTQYVTAKQAENAEFTMTEEQFIREIQRERAAEKFREENASFLWVKNIWVSDSAFKKAVETDWSSFKSTHQYEGNTNFGENEYNELLTNLGEEKTQANGYFILVILTAGVSLISQLVMNKTQKAQMELQTVDGQGAQTGKIMKWLMPIMMAVFAFMYTAAFSIYIILSSLISLGTTFLINFMVDRKYKKQKASKDNKVRGRVYTPKEEEKVEAKKEVTKSKDDKFAHQSGGDFLSNEKSSKSHIRGRLK
ncbi:MAG: membrane protein insertase YidC [Clostridiales bacterium]|nr:membrane protein insertase YidC [Clostridiales bacterium]